MSFEALIEKVTQAEAALEAREREGAADWRQFKSTWRKAWTPGRIVVAGVVSGFLLGRAQPARHVGATSTLRLLSTVSSLFAISRADDAAQTAKQAVAPEPDADPHPHPAPAQPMRAATQPLPRSAWASVPPRRGLRQPPASTGATTKPEATALNTTPRDPGTALDAVSPLPAPTPPADRPPRPRPRASSAIMVLATLAVAYTLWAAQGLLLPVLLAVFFALIGNPAIRMLQRLWVPRFLAAVLVLFVGLACTVQLGRMVYEPASEWIRQVPAQMHQLAPKMRDLVKPMQEANKAAENIARAAGGDAAARPEKVIKTEVNDPYKALTATPVMIASVLAVVLLTFFFMVYGQSLQRHALALLPSRQQKKLTVSILQSIEREMSRYVLTISAINFLLGLAFAGALFWLGVPLDEALLWGTMAAVLNFAPYVGPLIGMLIMLLMGFVAFDETWRALLPAGIYLGLHTLEGQLITPIVLGARMRLSPLVLILALMVFGWLWGIVGLLLAVPLLVCVKIVLSNLEGMEGWAKLME